MTLSRFAALDDPNTEFGPLARTKRFAYALERGQGIIWRVDVDSIIPSAVAATLPRSMADSVTALAVDMRTNLLVATRNGEVRRIDARTILLRDFLPSHIAPWATGADGATAMVVDRNGATWVAGGATRSIHLIADSAGGPARVAARGPMGADSTSPFVGIALSDSTAVLALDTKGSLYRWARQGDSLSGLTIVSSGPGLATATAMRSDGTGGVVVATSDGPRILRIASDGEVTVMHDDARAGNLRWPADLEWFDGRVFVSDAGRPPHSKRAGLTTLLLVRPDTTQ